MGYDIQGLVDGWIEILSSEYKNEIINKPHIIKSLAYGYPGLIILLSSYNQVYETDKYDNEIFHYVEMLVDLIKKDQSDISMFTGLTGVAFALRTASQNELRYKKAILAVDNLLIKLIQRFLIYINNDKHTAMSYYDVISGLSGVLRYLLIAVEMKQLNGSYNKERDQQYEDVIQSILQYLNNLSKFNNKLPGWYVPGEYLHDKNEYPNGVINDSFSHGSAGILATLSLAYLKGWKIPDIKDSISNISSWFNENIQYDTIGAFWPQKINVNSADVAYSRGRDAWCYGSIGVSRAMYLAAEALESDYYRKLSIDTFKDVTKYYLNNGVAHLDLGFCHGTSGIVRVLGRTIQDYGDPDLINGYNHLFQLLYMSFSKEKNSFLIKNELGLLEGPIGVCLTLLSYEKSDLIWDCCFCIA